MKDLTKFGIGAIFGGSGVGFFGKMGFIDRLRFFGLLDDLSKRGQLLWIWISLCVTLVFLVIFLKKRGRK